MLQLKNIIKNYYTTEEPVQALKGVSLNFRESEFVSILGQSGCGKTTLLNIIGGLDKYTDGDLIINNISTKQYTDRDWDSYRNNRIGFVFQSYNLIPHQTVLENVELALTLSGINKEERKERARVALEKVGLSSQISKRPNQLSGGQMQRVAIARAIVNNPDIILADEPTGALDSQTSVQIMDILKKISKEKLIIMVTHNPEIANEYSTRIINLKDGEVVGDSNPFEVNEKVLEKTKPTKKEKKINKKHSMSLFTAIKLSMKNLFTKKARTFLTSFAGSIGIIGIALILSLSTGFNNYIDKVQKDTLSNYPLTIDKTSIDITSILENYAGENGKLEKYPEGNTINSNDALSEMFSTVLGSAYTNDLKSFKSFLDGKLNEEKYKEIVSAVKYTYALKASWYASSGEEVNDFSMSNIVPGMTSATMMTDGVFQEMIDNEDLIKSQYDILSGRLPAGENKAKEVVLVLDNFNGINDVNLHNLGFSAKKFEYNVLKTYLLSMIPNATEDIIVNLLKEEYGENPTNENYTFEDFINLQFKVLTKADYYTKDDNTGLFVDYSEKKTIAGNRQNDRILRKAQYYMSKHLGMPDTMNKLDNYKNKELSELEKVLLEDAVEVKIVGIVRKKDGVTSGALTGTVCYTNELTKLLIENTKKSQIYNAQINEDNKDVVTGETILAGDKDALLESYGVLDIENPMGVAIYPTTFENKDLIVELIDAYNEDENNKEIRYTDYIGTMMSSITIIINAISYVLIAFVSISLVVSSIMIGIITYISVLERTKEIGVLRSLGASKKDISRVFNAETLIIGFVSGMLGIIITILLNIPITAIVQSVAKIKAVASLPLVGGVILVVISTVLTMISGLIPSRIAAKKDPVVALRTE